MKLEKIASIAADLIIADLSLAPRLRFAALAIKAAEQNSGVVPDEYTKQLEALELDAEDKEANAIIAAKMREESGGDPPEAA